MSNDLRRKLVPYAIPATLQVVRQQLILTIPGLLAIAIMTGISAAYGLASFPLGLMLLFLVLMVAANLLSIYVTVGFVSLLPAMTEITILVLGPIWAGWLALASPLLQGLVNQLAGERIHQQAAAGKLYSWERTMANAAIQTAAVVGAGFAYLSVGGPIPLRQMNLETIGQLVLLGGTYLILNYLLAGSYIWSQQRDAFATFRRHLPRLLGLEGLTLLFAPFLALVFSQLGLLQFLTATTLFLLVALVTRSLATTIERLQRRVQELDTLATVSQALAASLDINQVLQTLHRQVSRLMPADQFFVALYDKENQEVSFPLVIVNKEPVRWRARQAGNGLSEYVLRRRRPLLIRGNHAKELEKRGIEQIGGIAASWLGVPIIAGDEAVGVICVLSHTDPDSFHHRHQRVLQTIANQAAVVIQNARLYSQTDEALARRVQELNSILPASREGILLMNTEWEILTANGTLARLLSMPHNELHGDLMQRESLTKLGYTPEQLKEECRQAVADQKEIRASFAMGDRFLERTLIPVQQEQGELSGWLLVVRDQTEEAQLKQLQEELTQMLVHNLRSPLSAIIGYQQLLRRELDEKPPPIDLFLDSVDTLSQRMLQMINELLDINKLESDDMPLYRAQVAPIWLFENAVMAVQSLAEEAGVTIETEIAAGVPPMYADPDHMQRVLNNLVDNGIKHTPSGGRITLSARSNGEAIWIRVADTGVGIPQRELAHIFEKFHQVPGPKSRNRGTGLGLAYCKLMVEAHGGTISVQSEPGVGTTFEICLPLPTSEEQERDGDQNVLAEQEKDGDVPCPRKNVEGTEET